MEYIHIDCHEVYTWIINQNKSLKDRESIDVSDKKCINVEINHQMDIFPIEII